jgi:regulator of sigma E protease
VTPLSVLLAILALGFLIVVHESGHYFVARWCKMRVERFSIGFGPGILKRKTKSGTTFQLAPIPFGGFVEIRGMNIAEEVDPDDVNAYPNRPAWQRFVTILAGPATNYLSAIFLAFGLYMCHGQPSQESFHIGSVSDGYDAKGKIEPGDRIVAIDGVPMYSPASTKLSAAINSKHGAPLQVTVLRHGVQHVTLTVQPKAATDKQNNPIRDDHGKQLYRIGVGLTPDIVDVGIGEAAADAFVFPVIQTKAILNGLKDIFTGKEEADPGGPVRIVKEFNTAFSRGLPEGVMLLMMLSVYLGLFNLFPLPALDGGRLVFLGYEMVTRRRANPKIETMVHMGGIMVLMIVMILVTLHDFNVF